MATTYDPTTADPGTIQKIAAGTIVIDLNVRKDIRLDKSFVSSIRVRGFEQYPVGYLDDDGHAHITVGQRRVSAALEIGWDVVPIVIKPKADAEADRAEELRILTQLAENEQRSPLTAAETAGAYKELALFGVTEDQIARKTNSAKGRVQTAIKVADSTAALAAVVSDDLTLEQAAVLIEFEDDRAALESLREVAKTRPEQLEHAAQTERNRIARQRHGQSVADTHRAQGWEVITRSHGDEYGYGTPKGVKSLRDLARADDESRKAVQLGDVVGLEGRVVIIDPRYSGTEADISYGIRNPSAHGFIDRYSSGAAKGPLSDEEKTARRQKRTDKAEMTDATIVRRTWITDTLLQSKLDVDIVLPWIAEAALGLTRALGYGQASAGAARELACQWLGLDMVGATKYSSGDDRRTLDVALANAGTTQARLRIVLAYAIALVEQVAGNQRHLMYGQDPGLAPYFEQLQSWGYTLADVEQRIVATTAKTKR